MDVQTPRFSGHQNMPALDEMRLHVVRTRELIHFSRATH